MAPMIPWTDCYKLTLANQNPWQYRTLIISPLPRIPNKEKLELRNMNAKMAEYFFKALTSSARELHLQLLCVCNCIHIDYVGIKSFFILQLLINISSSVIHSINKHLLSLYYRFCSTLDSGDNEMRCSFGGRAGRQKVISKMTTIVYMRGAESLKKVAVGVKKRGQTSERSIRTNHPMKFYRLVRGTHVFGPKLSSRQHKERNTNTYKSQKWPYCKNKPDGLEKHIISIPEIRNSSLGNMMESRYVNLGGTDLILG